MYILHISEIKYSLPNLHKSPVPPKFALKLPMTHGFSSIFIGNTVKLGQSLTPVVSPDEIQHIRSKSE